jgi:hypothetical protein
MPTSLLNVAAAAEAVDAVRTSRMWRGLLDSLRSQVPLSREHTAFLAAVCDALDALPDEIVQGVLVERERIADEMEREVTALRTVLPSDWVSGLRDGSWPPGPEARRSDADVRF